MEIDDLLAEYVEVESPQFQGRDITKANYEHVIAYLRQREQQSHGLVKHGEAIRFLREWFA